MVRQHPPGLPVEADLVGGVVPEAAGSARCCRTSADVAAWIRVLAGGEASDRKTRAMATIERYLVHVGWAYRMAGLTDPTSDPLVKFERKAARNHLGVRQRQARAIRFDVTP